MDAPGRLDLIVVGDAMLDVTVDSGDLAPGGDVHGEVRIRPAGAGANAAVWAASRGARVRFYGRVGDDVAGRLLVDALRERGVEASLVPNPAVRTGAMLVVRQSGERSMVADRGANAGLAESDLPHRLAAGAVLISGYLLFDPGSERAAAAALERALARWVAVDAASWPLVKAFGAERFFQATKPANVLLANQREAVVLAGGGDALDPAEAAIRLGSEFEVVCLKRGPAGAIAAVDGRLVTASAPGLAEADPTGAGDAFDGVLLAELATGTPLEDALDSACMAGASAAASFDTWPPTP